jgi:hypothetical protein
MAVTAFNFFRRDVTYRAAGANETNGNATIIPAVPNSYYGSGALLLQGTESMEHVLRSDEQICMRSYEQILSNWYDGCDSLLHPYFET